MIIIYGLHGERYPQNTPLFEKLSEPLGTLLDLIKKYHSTILYYLFGIN